jgi:CBS-domain-containing membrane protein
MKTAEDIMSRKVITVSETTSVKELASTLLNNKISGVPVLDTAGKLVGIVTESDLIFQNKKLKVPAVIAILDSFLFLNNPDKMEKELKKIAGATVKDLCSEKVVTVRPDTPLDEIATMMIEKKMHTLPVVSETGEMLGIVGKKDIIRTIL